MPRCTSVIYFRLSPHVILTTHYFHTSRYYIHPVSMHNCSKRPPQKSVAKSFVTFNDTELIFFHILMMWQSGRQDGCNWRMQEPKKETRWAFGAKWTSKQTFLHKPVVRSKFAFTIQCSHLLFTHQRHWTRQVPAVKVPPSFCPKMALSSLPYKKRPVAPNPISKR